METTEASGLGLLGVIGLRRTHCQLQLGWLGIVMIRVWRLKVEGAIEEVINCVEA
jgi:hypothetical protein